MKAPQACFNKEADVMTYRNNAPKLLSTQLTPTKYFKIRNLFVYSLGDLLSVLPRAHSGEISKAVRRNQASRPSAIGLPSAAVILLLWLQRWCLLISPLRVVGGNQKGIKGHMDF